MADEVSWLIELTVKEGALDAFRILTAEMVEATRSEVGALTYERFVSDDGFTIHVYERYVDSASAVSHLRRFSELFADRYLALVERRRAFVYGPVTAELREALDGLSTFFLGRLDGFSR